jgi:hypothetical protein
MNHKSRLLVAVIGSLFAISAQADLVTFTGNTSTGPTYNRIAVDSAGDPTGVSSTSGTAVNYVAYTFSVTGGTYGFSTAGAFDTFTTLYSGAFDPAHPLTNAVIGNNGLISASVGTAGFSASLGAGTYTYVTTAANNTEAGFFSTSINGAGIVPISVPVPAAPSPRVLTVSGNTTGGPISARPDVDDGGTTIVSTNATAVAFQTFQFRVGAVGTYSFLSNGDYDTFLSVYLGAYDPSNPLANLIGFNDDGGDLIFTNHVSAFAEDLLPGFTYTLVTAGFANDSFGPFADAVVGPGAVSAVVAVPEPETLALMLSGFGLIGITSRRRKAVKA